MQNRYWHLPPEERKRKRIEDEDIEAAISERRLLNTQRHKSLYASFTPEGREAARKEAAALRQHANKQIGQERLLAAITTLKKAYALDREENTREDLIDAYVCWGLSVLAKGRCKQVLERLDPLKEEGLEAGGVHWVLARAHYMAFERADYGKVYLEHLKDAIREAGEAVDWEPDNAIFLLELARGYASHAVWWMATKNEHKYMERYQKQAVEAICNVADQGLESEEIIQGLLEVTYILAQTGDLTKLLPMYLLQTLGVIREPRGLPGPRERRT